MNSSRRIGMYVCGVAAALLFAFASALGAQDGTRQGFTIPACEQPPRMDGLLNDPCWRQAAAFDTLHLVGKDDTTSRHKAYVSRDDSWLYVAFDVAHPAADRRPVVHSRYDAAIEEEDCVLAFLDPGTGGRLYFTFLLNRDNIRAEERTFKATGPERKDWNIQWRSATSQDDKGWKAEIALPFSPMLMYGDVSRMRINLVVRNVLSLRDPSAVETGTRSEDASLVPLAKAFGEPERFARIQGLGDVPFKSPFLPFIEHATAGEYRQADGGLIYDVRVDFQSPAGRAGAVRLAITDRPVTGKATRLEEAVALTGARVQSVSVSVPVTQLVKRTALLEMIAPDTGELLQRKVVDDFARPDVFAAFAERSYYTSEKKANVTCDVGFPRAALKGMMLVAKDESGKLLARERRVSPHTAFGVPIEKLKLGPNNFVVELRQRRGTPITSQSVTLLKRAPKPGREWKIDHARRVLLDNGKPFFPIGMLPSGVKHDNELAFDDLAAAGFNTVLKWCHMTPEEGKLYCDAAQTRGLRVFDWIDVYARLKGGRSLTSLKGQLVGDKVHTSEEKSKIFEDAVTKYMPVMMRAVDAVKDHPNLMAYYLFDEPFTRHWFDQYVQGRRIYKATYERDGYHPIMTWWMQKEDGGWFDITGCDPYWSPGAEGLYGTPGRVAVRTWTVSQLGRDLRMPAYITPLAEFYSGTNKRFFLPEEQMCQTYLAIIHGAKAVLYWHYPVTHQWSYDALSKAAAHLRKLSPVLVTRDLRQEISYSPGVFDPAQKQLPDVQVSLRRNPTGGYVLLAANMRPYPVDATHTIAGSGKAGTVSRMFDSKTYPLADDAFNDKIEPMGIRAYLIRTAGAIEEPVRISVTMTSHPELARKETPTIPRFGRVWQKNTVANPSFEEFALPDWPLYYRPICHPPLRPDERTTQPGACYKLDAENPFHGKVSMRIRVGEGDRRWVYGRIAPVHERPTDYVFSVYLRADRPGVRVWVYGAGWKETVTVSTEWKRYSQKVTVPAKVSNHNCFYIRVGELYKKQAATVWIDAIQFERGDTPTEFEP